MTEEKAIQMLEKDLNRPVLKAHMLILDEDNYEATFISITTRIGHATKIDGIIIICWEDYVELFLN